MHVTCCLCLIYRRAAEKESHDEISMDNHKSSLAIENNAYATINDASKLQNP